ncbi:hypothetical protein WMY93_023080 [Mugilogobius chulae]|uniref:Uridylate-specific endoribonuclease n=1 Tax=Mugilogobius chulae TaxID=88201 RepID=A0AAW0N7S2_9GOBI
MSPGVDYTLSVQGRAGFVAQGSAVVVDHASAPLFSNVNENKFQTINTYAIDKLLDNYERSTGVAEQVTTEELLEISQFLDAVMQTPVMKSGLLRFEHVFVGETRSGNELIGFHNWVQFYLQEKGLHLDYKGFKAGRHDLPDQDDHVLNLQFTWHGVVKPVGSAFIGTSPEFEMALYTVVFLLNTERSTNVLVNIDQCQMELVVVRHGRSIETAYPRLLSSNSRHLRQQQSQSH